MLRTLLATLLPGDADWPDGASVAAPVEADMAVDPSLASAVAEVLAALPPGFAPGDEPALRAVEEGAHGPAFERVVAAAYLAYYTDPAVRAVLERVCSYEDRPPQPLGYALEPFDEALLAVQRRRAPFWRDPDKEAPGHGR